MQINPFAMFMSFRPVVKVFVIVSIAAVLITFMVLAYKSGNFDILMNWLFPSPKA